jgi:hypothetical protein
MEAEWRAIPLCAKIEEERAQQEHRASSAIFLRQARFALSCAGAAGSKVSHLHATSSALVCARILQQLADEQ